MNKATFDVIVVGGGHAGCEAAAAAARMGARTALVTHRFATIGEMSCNPAIGGLGKGHLVREIDALDGLMGRVADAAGIQFRLLNRSKGPAVQGPRAQADRKLYRAAMQAAIRATPNLEVIEGAVEDLLVQNGAVAGIVTADGRAIRAGAVVLTTGTFLRGLIHRGEEKTPAGRHGEPPANGLSAAAAGARSAARPAQDRHARPPRRAHDRLGQPGNAGGRRPARFLSPSLPSVSTTHRLTAGSPRPPRRPTPSSAPILPARPCIPARSAASARATAPPSRTRWCALRPAQRHQIFLEPEGLDDDTVYPNGISTSLAGRRAGGLPAHDSGAGEGGHQALRLRHRVRLRRSPRARTRRSRSSGCRGCSWPARSTAPPATRRPPPRASSRASTPRWRRPDGGRDFLVSRADGYMGVMIDDLVTRGVDEPYRMFTSRAEYRLRLRADNADQRLTPTGLALGLIQADRRDAFARKCAALEDARRLLDSLTLTPNEAARHGLDINKDGRRRTAFELLARPGIGFGRLRAIWPELGRVEQGIAAQLEVDARYASYVDRQEADIVAFRKEESVRIPADFDYAGLASLSCEVRQKLEEARPATLAQAARMEGMTPAALMLLLAHLRRAPERRTA